jgi:hypothetical protein
MLIKLDPMNDALGKNMFRLDFRQSPKPQRRTKHLHKTKLKDKVALSTLEYFLKFIVKDLLMPHT